MAFNASASEYSNKELLEFIATVESCNATYGLDIATTQCVVGRDGIVMLGLLSTMVDNLGASTEVAEDRYAASP